MARRDYDYDDDRPRQSGGSKVLLIGGILGGLLLLSSLCVCVIAAALLLPGRPVDAKPIVLLPAPQPQPAPVQNPPVAPPAIPPAAVGQNNAGGPYLVESMVRVTDLADRAKNFQGYGYNDNISILAAWVGLNQSVTFTYPLNANTDYMFLAAGDNDAQIIDLEIFDNVTNARVAFDQNNKPTATVAYRPQFNGVYTLKLAMIQSNGNVPCVCSLVILRKNGWTVPFKNLDDVTLSLSKLITNLNQNQGPKLGKKYDLRSATNQWAVYGGFLKQGADLTVTNMDLGFGDRVFAGACDGFSDRLDLDLLNQGGATIGQSQGAATTAPFMTYRVNGPGYGMRIRNTASPRGPSLVMMAVLDCF